MEFDDLIVLRAPYYSNNPLCNAFKASFLTAVFTNTEMLFDEPP
jgi:hypothetical protein